MVFTATPVDGSSTPIPMSSAVPDTTNTPLAIEGGPAKSTGGNSLAPVATYQYDGYNVVEGVTTDAAVTGDNSGTISAKLRGWSKMLFDVWDSVNHRLHVSVDNANANGQNTMVNSSPVVLASDQFHAANTSGVIATQLPAMSLYAHAAGGPVDSTGKPQGAEWDRVASWQGKVLAGASANITSTLAGDTNLVFGAAPKTIAPGQKIQLSVATGNPVETVIVATSYVPSSTATTIPLQYPVVNAGNTTAKWDSYTAIGPGTSLMTVGDVLPIVLTAYDQSSVGLRTLGTAGADGITGNNALLASPGLYNGTNVDRMRANVDVSLLASAARTTTQTSADIVNYNARGIKVWLDMTVVGTGSVTLTINGKDPASGKYILLLSGVAVVTNITSVYTIYPGAPVTANVSVNDILPRTFQIVVTANNANSATYSVGYSLIL